MSAMASFKIIITAFVSVFAGHSLTKAVKRWLNDRMKYDGLDGVVSYSSRKIAAYRALESEQADPLFVDPLAELMAGPRALQQARQMVSRQSAPVGPSELPSPPALLGDPAAGSNIIPASRPSQPGRPQAEPVRSGQPWNAEEGSGVQSGGDTVSTLQSLKGNKTLWVRSDESVDGSGEVSGTSAAQAGSVVPTEAGKNPTGGKTPGRDRPLVPQEGAGTYPSRSRAARDAGPEDSGVGTAAGADGAGQFSGEGSRFVTRIAIRTKWFDDRLLQALSGAAPGATGLQLRMGPAPSGGEGVYVDLHAVALPLPQQVVLLGAGMDSRAWRLPLPPGTRWFEVDKADVLAAKEALLCSVGALPMPEPGQGPPSWMLQRLRRKLRGKKLPPVPLRTASWTPVVADLNVEGWVSKLEQTGFDPRQGTVWLAEGLLMYIDPDRVPELLREMQGVSAPGSCFLVQSVTEALVAKCRTSLSELMRSWCFGCPEDPSDYFRVAGWKVEECSTRSDMAKEFGSPRLLTAFPSGTEQSRLRRVLFIVARPCPA
eukprot:jgi/Botrbrau1/872/Bobra.0352s0061.1